MNDSLNLQAYFGNWLAFQKRKKTKLLQRLKSELCEISKSSCQYCGCQLMTESAELINGNGDYTDNSFDNFRLVCQLCAKVCLVDRYSLEYEGQDRIVFLPELSQIQLNHLLRALQRFIDEGGQKETNAKVIYAQLIERAVLLDQITSANLSHPGIFVHYFNQEDCSHGLVEKLRLVTQDFSLSGLSV